MSVELGKDEVFSAAVEGLPKVAELIATFPVEDRGQHWRQPSRAISILRGSWATRKPMLGNGRRRSCFDCDLNSRPSLPDGC